MSKRTVLLLLSIALIVILLYGFSVERMRTVNSNVVKDELVKAAVSERIQSGSVANVKPINSSEVAIVDKVKIVDANTGASATATVIVDKKPEAEIVAESVKKIKSANKEDVVAIAHLQEKVNKVNPTIKIPEPVVIEDKSKVSELRLTRALVDNPHVTEQIRKDTLNELADEKKKIAASAPAGKEPTAKEQEQAIDKVWASYCKSVEQKDEGCTAP